MAQSPHAGAKELILSGGDPLAVRNERLFELLDRLAPAFQRIRIHTRAPIVAPDRIDEALVAGLAARGPVWLVVHCNHPRELQEEVRGALARLVEAGIPLLNQAVLLKGVNDSVDTLAELGEALLASRVKPYYLHQVDPVPGNAHFRVDPERALSLHRRLAERVSGLALPSLVVDLPSGEGKISLDRAVAEGRLR
jgi:KamA family protein